MKGVILVGGQGTRLRPLTLTTPKAMVPVLNRPFLEHMITHLASHGVRDIVLAAGYLPEEIRRHFQDGSAWGVHLTYVLEDEPLGTAGGIRNALRDVDGPCFAFNGDILTDVDLGAMIEYHREKGGSATLYLRAVEDPSRFGVVELDEDGRIQSFVEKPPKELARSNLINAGIYLLEPDVLESINPGTRVSIEHEVFPAFVGQSRGIYGYVSPSYWIDIGTPQQYLQVNSDLLRSSVDGHPVVGAACRIHDSALIDPPVLMGAGCVIGPGATLRGPLILGNSCVVGAGATVENAVLWDGVEVGENARLSGCVVGNGVKIGKGAVIEEHAIIASGAVLEDRSHVAAGWHVQPGARIPGTAVEAL